MTDFRVHALLPALLAQVRATGLDTSGNPVQRLTGVTGPLRCCLRSARADEDVILFGYEPVLPGSGSPYREVGAVYAHASHCDGPEGEDYPAQWLSRPQVLRAYDARGWIHPATRTHDGSDPLGEIASILAEPDVVEIHSRNIAYGCYMFSITRA
ncbi:DUF1203 domain-containing protein [Allokutzneria sp. NRRL B-24872]|uniref:DUF1203 domain-containing protein n=1 Tax=Allokutzneria sp. NRRL B-24872 TaxID=1137961 RepID=UPI000A3A7B17|nr:DUF1203 domain-containing protein [Allokutzneria sp. NRRL B-24872]